MERQLAERARRMQAGERHRGWKVGLTSTAALEHAGVQAPLIGFLTDRTVLAAGAPVGVDGLTNPVIEAEIAVSLRSDVSVEASDDALRTAIGSVRPAIELAAGSPHLLDDLEELLAANLFHQYIVLGAGGVELTALERAQVEVRQLLPDGAPTGVTASPADMVEVIRHVATYLAAFDLALQAEDLIMTGAIIPPVPALPGEAVRFAFPGFDDIEISIAGNGAALA